MVPLQFAGIWVPDQDPAPVQLVASVLETVSVTESPTLMLLVAGVTLTTGGVEPVVFGFGVQRITNEADGLEADKVCESEGEIEPKE
jgi:hypothetical protein